MKPNPARDARAIAALNELPSAELARRFEACCGSRTWVAEMVTAAPFATVQHLLQAAERAADGLRREDWLEAFAHHPRIGDLDSLRAKYGATDPSRQWAQGEQSGAADADDKVLRALAIANQTYEERFGFIFIVCATGKSADEMLTLLRRRMFNDPLDGTELQVAAGEQRKITRLRIEKLLAALLEEKHG